ncbi:MAG TPA: hypothetical protein VGN34_14425 [Ktedonobacteraceae bacterium]|jgi:hypothetical protein
MQGRQGPGDEPWDKYASQRLEALSQTSRQRAIQRPAQMAQRPVHRPISENARTPRVGRLKKQETPQRPLRQRIIFWGCGLLVFAVLVAVGTYIGFNLINAAGNSSGAAKNVADFLASVQEAKYDQAYTYLSPAITLHLAQDDFINRAKNDDLCFGTVKDYTIVQNSTTYQSNNQSYTYTYTITRAKQKQTYQLHITLQQDPNAANTWKITDYSNDLGPTGQPVAACK